MSSIATRRERVVLELVDDFSPGMAKAAASAALLKREVNGIGGEFSKANSSTSSATKATKEYTAATALADEKAARLRKTLRDQARATLDAEQGVTSIGKSTERTGNQIDRLSGRLALFAQAAAVLGPALVPIGAAAVPVLTGLTTQMGLAGVAAGVTVLAFHGVGDALSALNAYDLEPSQANFEKLQESMRGLGPAARDFVTYLHTIGPELSALRVAAQDGVLPGAEDGLKSLMTLAPRAEAIISNVATTVGELLAEAGDSLAGPKWAAFFDYLQSDAAPILTELGHTLGNVVQGLGSMLTAFAPLTASFSSGLDGMARSFANWAAGLSSSEGFEEFVDYVRASGPQVLDLLGSLAHLLINLSKAAAPIGAIVLPAVTSLVKVLAAIAGSPVGAPLIAAAAGFSAISRAVALFEVAKATKMVGFLTGAGPAGAGAAAGMSAAAAAAVVFAGAFAGDWLMKQGNANLGITEMTANLQQMAETGRATDALNNLGFSVDSLGEKLHRAAYLDDPFGISHSKDDIKEMDAALTGMASGPAAEAFLVIKKQAAAAGVSFNDLMELFPQYQKSLAAATPMTANIGNDLAGVKDVVRDLAPAFGSAAQSANEFTASVQKLQGVFSKRSEFRDYQAAIDAISESLKANGRTLDANTPKGRANGAALDDLAQKSLTYAQTLKGIDRVEFLANARKQFVDAAEGFGKTATEAGHLASKLGLIPRNVETAILLDGALDAQAKVAELAQLYGKTPRQVRTLIKQAGAEPTMDKIRSLARQYGLTPKQVITLLTANDKASGKAIAARAQAEKFATLYSAALDAKDGASPKAVAARAKAAAFAKKYAAFLEANDRSSGVVRTAIGVLQSFNGRHADAYITTHHLNTYASGPGKSANPGGSANGNLFLAGRRMQFAAGGFTDSGQYVPREPQVRQGGGNILWSEPETGWEAYISGKPGQEDRNADIWREAGDRLGMDWEEYLHGGLKTYTNGGGPRYGDGIKGTKGYGNNSPDGKTHYDRDGDKKRERERDADHKKEMDQHKKRREALKEFDLKGGQTWRDVRSEFRDFAKATGGMTKQLRHLEKAAEGVAKKYNEQKAALEDAKSKRDDLKSAAAQSFNGDLYGNGVAGLNLQLQADANDATAMTEALKELKDKGISKEFAESLSQSGDLNTAQQLAGMSNAQIVAENQLYGSRVTAQNNLGTTAVDVAGYTTQIAELKAAIKHNSKVLDNLEARVERGAHTGTKAGAEGKNKEVRQRRQTG